jgi:hypothetical protein
MLDNLKYEDYVAELNTKFKLAETSIELELIEVTQRNLSPQQEIFSLIFAGAKDNFLEQRIYLLHHEKLGEGDLFLVPIAEKHDGYHYEAGFNRIIAGK